MVPEEISLTVLNQAIYYIDTVQDQKEVLHHFIRELTATKKDKTKIPPSYDEIAHAIVKTNGPVISYRSFKQTTSRKYRSVMLSEYTNIVHDLIKNDCGRIISVRTPGATKDSNFYIKGEFQALPHAIQSGLDKEVYERKKNANIPKCVSETTINLVLDK